MRAVPIWVLTGLAAAGYLVLFLPVTIGIAFRDQYSGYIWTATLVCSALDVACIADRIIATVRAHMASRALRVVSTSVRRPWAVTPQQDGTVVTQFEIRAAVTNLTWRPVRIVHAFLVRPRPKNDVLNIVVSLSDERTDAMINAVPHYGTATATVFALVRRALGVPGRSLPVTIALIDQFGDRYTVRTQLPSLYRSP